MGAGPMADEITYPSRRVFPFISRGVAGLDPRVQAVLPQIEEIIQKCLGNPTYRVHMTGAQEWKGHGWLSRHHTGFAVDIRTRDFPGGGCGCVAKQVARRVQRALGSRFYVLLHMPPDPPHLHVEYRRGARISEPGDFPSPRIGPYA
jgi:hypothetical protein